MNQWKWIPAFAGMTALLFSVLSCTKEHRTVVSDALASGPSGPATLSSIQPEIFRLGCAISGCHDNTATPASNMNLTTAAKSYSSLVNQVSLEANGLLVVDPGHPEKSYLINKLRGTHLQAGGTGVRMPQYAAPLVEGDIERIETWITNGALNN